jgi:hypothetical protein
MPSRKWDEDKVAELAKSYESLQKFRSEQKGAYLWMCKHGLTPQLNQHMTRALRKRGHWSKEMCLEEANLYHYRSEFMRGSGSAYNAALKNGWLDEVCAHMKTKADGVKHCVYLIKNDRLNLAYVGVTRQLFSRRIKAHKNQKSTSNAKKIANLPDTVFELLTGYDFQNEEVKDAETFWFRYFADQGFEMLNSERTLGFVGVADRKYSDAEIISEGKKYSTRSEFKKQSPKIYDAAVTQRLLSKACVHMRGINPKNYWSKERCIAFAKSCSDRTEFSKNQSAMDAVRKNGWTEEVYLYVRSKNDMTWLRKSTRVEIWSLADYYYDIWVANDRCGYWRMRTLTGINLQKMIAKFQTGWVPKEDEDWMQWAQKVKNG